MPIYIYRNCLTFDVCVVLVKMFKARIYWVCYYIYCKCYVCMYELYVITEYLYPLLTILSHFAFVTGCQIVHTTWMLKGKDHRLLKIAHTTWSHLHTRTLVHAWHTGTHIQIITHSQTCTHARTPTHTRTHVLFKPCICRKHNYVLNCVSKVYMLIYFYILFCCVCLYYSQISFLY